MEIKGVIVSSERASLRQVKSCGVILFRSRPRCAFLLLRHPERWDPPKGHVKRGESDLQCALRELEEETGIKPHEVKIDPRFRFSITYRIHHKRFGGQLVEKTVVFFLGRLEERDKIILGEHEGYRWIDWPPGSIQAKTIDPLLEAVKRQFEARANPC